MDERLDEEFEQWVGRMGIEWAIPIDDVPKYLGHAEVANRLQLYPAFGMAATRRPVDLIEFGNSGGDCWALGGQFDRMKFNTFVSLPESADAIAQLVADFPEDDDDAAQRIDAFIGASASLGYSNPKTGKFDVSNAALLASTILTATFQRRFVDFRQNRWKELADELDYPFLLNRKPTYGQMIIETGRFATTICDTKSFKRFWPDAEPLWTIAGICWSANSGEGAERPKGVPDVVYEEDFDEGAAVLRKHMIRERNMSIVKKAKDAWRASDPLLRCDVCLFSFVEAYGADGDGYIEAHHTKPLGSLKNGAKTRVSDLAKVCANCHRMLHLNAKCLELDELRAKLRNS